MPIKEAEVRRLVAEESGGKLDVPKPLELVKGGADRLVVLVNGKTPDAPFLPPNPFRRQLLVAALANRRKAE